MTGLDEFRGGMGSEGFEGAFGSFENFAILFEHEDFFDFVGFAGFEGVFFGGEGGAVRGGGGDDTRMIEGELEHTVGDRAERRANVGDVLRRHKLFADELFMDEVDNTGKAHLVDGGFVEQEDSFG